MDGDWVKATAMCFRSQLQPLLVSLHGKRAGTDGRSDTRLIHVAQRVWRGSFTATYRRVVQHTNQCHSRTAFTFLQL